MAALLFISFIVLLLIGVPVAFAIAAAALLVLLKGDVKLLILVQRMFASTDSFSLIAVPFFIFAGDLLAKGKVSKVLVEFAESLLGMLKGGLSIVSVLAGMFFAAISGSGAATTAAVGATLIPELKKRGYDVYMIRRKQNVNISNKQRAIRANKSGADICIRLHADAASANVRGVSVLYPSQQNPYVAKLSKKSKKLSKNILDSYCKSTKFKKRGLSKRDDLTGTNWSKIPVALIEMGFMTNKTEDKQMQKKQTQKKMVDGIANGIDQYFK